MVLSLPSRQRHATKLGLFLVVLLSWYTAFGQHCKPKDCVDLKCYRVSTADGGAMIYPESVSFTKIEVTCKQTGDGGGWIVYLRRFDGSLSFKRPWDDYKSGFGEQGESKESWLGNENVHQLIKSFIFSMGGLGQLRIEAYAFNGTSCVTTLDEWGLKDETNCYMLVFSKGVSSHDGVVEDWKYSKERHFATFDHTRGHNVCFNENSGGWWYGGSCQEVCLTGRYVKDNSILKEFHVNHFNTPLKAVDMLFRPMNHIRACNNPCNNGGTCEYIEATNNHRCVCPETHCGAKCETDNPCKHNGTCVYSLDTKQISCVCVGSYTGTHCDAKSEQETGAKVVVIAVSSLLVVLVVGGIATWMIVGNKRRRAQEEERLAREEKERQRLLFEEQEKEKEGLFGYLFS